MNQLDYLAERRPSDGINAKTLLKDDREWAVCYNCPRKNGLNVRHPLRGNNADQDYREFAQRHAAIDGHVVVRVGPEYMERAVRRAENRKRRFHLAIKGFIDNASVLEAIVAAVTIDATGFTALASSVTAGWCSAWLDNHTNLYLDYLGLIYMAAVNTAAATPKAGYVYAASAHDTTNRPINNNGIACTNSASTSATMTFVDVTANPSGFNVCKVIPYVTTNKAINSGVFSTAPALGGYLGNYVWYPYINGFNPASYTASGAVFLNSGVYLTVA